MFSVKRKTAILFSYTMVAGIVVGCSGSNRPDGFPRLHPCTIQVTQEDQPLAGATVILNSENDEYAQWSIAGSTDERGVAILATEGRFVGAPVGDFVVTLYKQEQEREDVTRPGFHEREYRFGDTFNMVDPVYNGKDTSPIKITVKSGKNKLAVDAGKPVRIKVDGGSRR